MQIEKQNTLKAALSQKLLGGLYQEWIHRPRDSGPRDSNVSESVSRSEDAGATSTRRSRRSIRAPEDVVARDDARRPLRRRALVVAAAAAATAAAASSPASSSRSARSSSARASRARRKIALAARSRSSVARRVAPSPSPPPSSSRSLPPAPPRSRNDGQRAHGATTVAMTPRWMPRASTAERERLQNVANDDASLALCNELLDFNLRRFQKLTATNRSTTRVKQTIQASSSAPTPRTSLPRRRSPGPPPSTSHPASPRAATRASTTSESPRTRACPRTGSGCLCDTPPALSRLRRKRTVEGRRASVARGAS